MTYEIEVTTKSQAPVKYLRAKCGVRYWEDSAVNNIDDEDGTLIPCRQGDCWAPTIELATGKILDWPEGTEASLHYKVCDDGTYELLNESFEAVKVIDGYVPEMMCPGGDGYGDYVIMEISTDGLIENWKVDLDAFA